MFDSLSAHPAGELPPRRRHGKHTIYVRPDEAQHGHMALDALLSNADSYGYGPEQRAALMRLRDKLYTVDWPHDYDGVSDDA